MLDRKMVNLYFRIARERENIRLARAAGKAFPWTKDEILSSYRFTNVRREDDRTTIWFRENLREPLRDTLDHVLLATVAFRTFNLISTGEILKPMLLRGEWDGKWVRKALAKQKPVVTGAYIVRTPWGVKKMEGACRIVEGFLKHHAKKDENDYKATHYSTELESYHKALLAIPYFGHFTAYEIVSDLRWTKWLEDAPDINLWANPGPGCLRGMSYLIGRRLRPSRRDRTECLVLMRELLRRSRSKSYWPQDWPAWEMREVEHWLCEFSKYQHAMEGKRLKRRFKI